MKTVLRAHLVPMTPGQGGEAFILGDEVEVEEFKGDEIAWGFLDNFKRIQAREVSLASVSEGSPRAVDFEGFRVTYPYV